jgi:hypothetical protein
MLHIIRSTNSFSKMSLFKDLPDEASSSYLDCDLDG